MLLAWAIGCGADGFVEVPVLEQGGALEPVLRVPSLAGCTWEQSDVLDQQFPQGRDLRLAYDEHGRLRSVEGAAQTNPYQAMYLWTGDCLSRIERQQSGIPYYEAFTCDERGNPVSATLSRIVGPDEVVVQVTRAWLNAYDALGQLIRADLSVDGMPVETTELLWDGQGRISQRDVTNLLVAEEVKRQLWWDHDRLIGFEDRGPREDLAMDRLYDRHRILEQRDYLDEVLLTTTSWTYDGDAPWPVGRRTEIGAVGFEEQEITVTCSSP